MNSRDCFELPGGRICRISGIDIMSTPFQGVMYKGRFVPVELAKARMKDDGLNDDEIATRASRTWWGFTLTMRGGTEVPVIGETQVGIEGWHHQLKGIMLN